MTNLQRLAAHLPVKRISRREMYLFKLKMRVRALYELNMPILYRYWKKIMSYLGIHL